MARNQSAFINWSQYLALRGVAGLVQCFDVDENLHTAAGIGTLYYSFNAGRRRRAIENIATSFPEFSPEQVRDVARRSMQHMFQLMLVESIMTPRLITPDTWTDWVQIGDLGPLLDLLVRGEPGIFVTGHCGNWELLGCALSAIGYPLVALARPLDNPLIDRWLQNIREARGMKVVTKWGATPIIQDTLREGGRVGFIADQNAGDQGLFVPFFGRLASSYKSIGLLAMRYRVPVISGIARRVGGRFRYQFECTDIVRPDDWAHQPDPLFYITARFNKAIENMIRSAPEQYLWLHRRWKSRPKHEREGKPMPAKLISKLEQLPWMTQNELDLIVQRSNAEAAEANGQVSR